MEEPSVNVLEFAEARASEIASLMKDVNQIKKFAQQSLPPHMRRRAASHNPKRIPPKLRALYLKQNPHANDKPKKAPKKMRKKQQKKKHEKQAKDYPVEYSKRSREGELWLGTHIWHAKRCQMDTLWGYKLPIHCNDKKLGATHQAATKHAMLLDISYYCCISLDGPEDQLLESLSSLTDPNSASNFASASYSDGDREGHTVVYHPNKFPFEAIGPVNFIWRPVTNLPSDSEVPRKRSLWIWCHPSFHDQLVDVLTSIFKLDKKESTKVSTEDSEVPENVKFNSRVNLEKVRQHYFKESIFVNGSIQMSLLKDKLVRHRVIGPNSQSVVTNVLELANVEDVSLLFENSRNDSSVNEVIGFEKPLSTDNETLDESTDNELSKCKSGLKHICTEDHNYPVPKRIKLDSEIFMNGSDNINNSHLQNGTELSSKLLNSSNKTDIKSMPDSNHVASIEALGDGEKKKSDIEVDTSDNQCWWKQYYNSESAKSAHRKRKKLLEHLRNNRSGYYIAPSSVIGLTVRDPRLILSRNKQKFVATEDSNIEKDVVEFSSQDIADSPLWDGNIRNEVTATQIPESEINNERAKYIIPSESSSLGESRVPILLIHQPGINGFGSGWDLIAPLGWSMAFWIPLILNGGRATGLRDLHFVNMETGKPSIPLSYPDTNAGKTHEEKQRVDELTTYFKRPKAKRPNFTTFGTLNPFFMPWNVLVEDWVEILKSFESKLLFPVSTPPEELKTEFSENNSFFVLRQKEVRTLQNVCERLSRLPRGNKAIRELDSLKQVYNEIVSSCLSSRKELQNSLVLIRTKCLTRGCPTIHSGLYAVDENDLKEIKRNPNFLGPKEPNHTKGKKGDDSSITDELAKKSDDSQTPNLINSKDMDRPQIQTLKSASSHKMIGYLSEGGFSSISGKGCGTGHCSLIGLLFVIRDCIDHQLRPLVLVREQHSFQYRVSSLEIVPNYL